MLQLFWLLLSTALAITNLQSKIVVEEVDVAFSGEVNENLSVLLGLDAFQTLDVDGNGFLSKAEIKPFVSHYLKLAAQTLAEHGGMVVSRENFMQHALVPDLGAFGSEFNTKYCYLDHAFTETSASALWTEAFGEIDYVTVEEFVEKIFEAFQPEIKAPSQNVLKNLKKSKTFADRLKVPFVKLDDYLKVRSPACESRRNLLWGSWDIFNIGFWYMTPYLPYYGYSSWFDSLWLYDFNWTDDMIIDIHPDTIDTVEDVVEDVADVAEDVWCSVFC